MLKYHRITMKLNIIESLYIQQPILTFLNILLNTLTVCQLTKTFLEMQQQVQLEQTLKLETRFSEVDTQVIGFLLILLLL